MNSLDLNQIMVFVKVVESGSFTKAAEVLNQPKSRLSRRLAALEKSLETQLLYRTTRQMQLTEAGKEYYRKCAPLLQNLQEANTTLTSKSEQLSGTIRVTAPEDFGKMILSHLIDEFLKIHPKVRFDVVLAGAYLDLVKESIDVAVRIGSLKDASLKSKKVLELSSIVVASPAFLEKHGTVSRPEQLREVPCLSFTFMRKGLWRLLREKHEVRIKTEGSVIANSPEFMYHFALLGRGAALLPPFLCEEALKDGRLVHILKGWASPSVPIHLLTPAQKETSLRTKLFMGFVWERLNS